jgi:hypothetical protein
MKRFASQWLICSGVVLTLLLVIALLFSREFMTLADDALRPWMKVCQMVTPAGWQVRGNILLGLLWIISGLAAYSILLGLLMAMASHVWRKVPKRY